jgi:hypothetical protein
MLNGLAGLVMLGGALAVDLRTDQMKLREKNAVRYSTSKVRVGGQEFTLDKAHDPFYDTLTLTLKKGTKTAGFIRAKVGGSERFGVPASVIVNNIHVEQAFRRKLVGTRLYELAASFACNRDLPLVSALRTEGAKSNDFWEKQLRKGRAKIIGQIQGDPVYELDCGQADDLSGFISKQPDGWCVHNEPTGRVIVAKGRRRCYPSKREATDVWHELDCKYTGRHCSSGLSGADAAVTSVNCSRVPALFKHVELERGTVNLDLGGGKCDTQTAYLKRRGVKNLVLDPYNRPAAQTRKVERELLRRGEVDTVTLSNVLNVIPGKAERRTVLETARAAAPVAFISVYEGDRSGRGRRTRTGSFQANRRLRAYEREVRAVFPRVERRGTVLVATR